MTGKPTQDDDNRIHNQAPAEGDPATDPSDLRVHTQDPAEGGDDTDDANADTDTKK